MPELVSDLRPDSAAISFMSQMRSAVAHASKEAVEKGLASSSEAHSRGRFLEETHPQIASPSADYEYQPDDTEEAQAYVAASCLGHSSDAWSYFAQAIRAIVAGEFSLANHLLYYSELRSAFSILARHGILIRNNRHVGLTSEGVTVLGDKGTHEAVWLALKAWAKTADAKSFFLDGTRLGGQPVSEWLAEDRSFEGDTMHQIFDAIGYDLNRYSQDRTRRNSASYGAYWLRQHAAVPMKEWFVPQLQDLWGLLEPVGTAGFEGVDARLASHIILAARKRKKDSVQRDKFLPYVRDLAKKVGANQPEAAAQLLMSTAEIKNDRSIIGLALKKQNGVGSADDELLSMMARAFLLARFASAAASDLITKSGIATSELDFWYANIGLQTGLWSPGTRQSPFEILEDIRGDLDVLSDAVGAPDLHTFIRSGQAGIHGATSFGLVAVWTRGDFEAELPVVA